MCIQIKNDSNLDNTIYITIGKNAVLIKNVYEGNNKNTKKYSQDYLNKLVAKEKKTHVFI